MLETTKKFLWKLIEPLFPTIRDIWVALGFMEHNSRQLYHFGWLKQEISQQDLRRYLHEAGFINDYLAWVDPDEVINMRKIVNNIYQYHVRLFNDGELRGHYEFTAESHPLKHLFERGMRRGEDYLLPLLKPIMTSEPFLTKLNSTLPQPHSADSRKTDNDASL